jgi:hypothetical protein
MAFNSKIAEKQIFITTNYLNQASKYNKIILLIGIIQQTSNRCGLVLRLKIAAIMMCLNFS